MLSKGGAKVEKTIMDKLVKATPEATEAIAAAKTGLGVPPLVASAISQGARASAEMAAFQTAHNITEDVLGDRELTAESILAGVPDAMTLGAAFGVAMPLAGTAILKTTEMAKAALDKIGATVRDKILPSVGQTVANGYAKAAADVSGLSAEEIQRFTQGVFQPESEGALLRREAMDTAGEMAEKARRRQERFTEVKDYKEAQAAFKASKEEAKLARDAAYKQEVEAYNKKLAQEEAEAAKHGEFVASLKEQAAISQEKIIPLSRELASDLKDLTKQVQDLTAKTAGEGQFAKMLSKEPEVLLPKEPELVSEIAASTIKNLAEPMQKAIEKLKANEVLYSPSVAARLEDIFSRFADKLGTSLNDSTAMYKLVDATKKELAEHSKFGLAPSISEKAALKEMKGLAKAFKSNLEDEAVWGAQAARQMKLNEPISDLITLTGKDGSFRKAFMTKIAVKGTPGRWEIDPIKVQQFLSQFGTIKRRMED
jgi:hypothetical protein